MIRSRRIIRQFKPDVAVGVGGYASGPILKAAARRKVPILIQEQNSYAGVTNRILARSAATICVAYDQMDRFFPARKIVLTGNPVRQQLINKRVDRSEAFKEFGLDEGKKTCLVLGGSGGARTLNHAIMDGLEKLDRSDLQVLWQCGITYQQEAERSVIATNTRNIRVVPFISSMDQAYGIAEVIISRAGAITISELCLVGKPVILVPSPNVAGDHQTMNARALVSRNAALMVPDVEAGASLVETMLKLMENAAQKQALSNNIKELGIPDAAQRIAAEVFQILEEK